MAESKKSKLPDNKRLLGARYVSKNLGGARPGSGRYPKRITLSPKTTQTFIDASGYKNIRELLAAMDRGEVVISLEKLSKSDPFYVRRKSKPKTAITPSQPTTGRAEKIEEDKNLM